MKYAILLSGGVNDESNYLRYNNDLAFSYNILLSKYNFDNVEVFYYDGSDLEYLGQRIRTTMAVKFYIQRHLEKIIQNVNEDDTLFILVSNHGSRLYNCSYIRLYGENLGISIRELYNYLDQINCKKVIVLGECFSGELVDYNLKNSIIITACEKDKKSYASYSNYSIDRIVNGNKETFDLEFDEFIVHFMSYLNGAYPNGTKIEGDSSIESAYKYAVKMDKWSYPGERYQETPQIRTNIEDIIL